MAAPRNVAVLPSSLVAQEQPSAGSYEAAVADDLAGTVEHVLNSRYSGARMSEESSPRPRAIMQPVTSESLLAELAVARQSRPAEPRATEAETPRRSRSRALRLFAFVGFAMIAHALLMKSPWRDQVPSIDRITQLLN